MLKRLWFLLSVLWAAANLLPGDPLDGKLLGMAFAPFALGLFVEIAGRYVITGSVRRH